MNEFDATNEWHNEGPAVRRGDRLIIKVGERDVPAIATSDVLPDGVIHVACSTTTARVPVSAVRPAN